MREQISEITNTIKHIYFNQPESLELGNGDIYLYIYIYIYIYCYCYCYFYLVESFHPIQELR